MLHRIKNNPKTTWIGVIIVLASVASVFVDRVSWTEASIGIAAGTAFLFSKDRKP